MSSKWPTTTIGALCKRHQGDIQTGPFGSQLHAHDYVENGSVPVVTTSSVGRRKLETDGLPRISREKADSLGRHYLKPGDIVFARRGAQAAGLSAIVKEEHAGWLGGTGIIRLRLPSSAIDAEYLSFALASDACYEWIRQQAIGATMPNLNKGIIQRLEVPLPPLPEQRRIAAILGALDDKIELNRKMNETLEEMAQAIFKSWFIDFDGHDDLVESELGLIPRGWGVKAIGKIVECVGGSTPSTKNDAFWDGGSIPFTTPKDLSGVSSPVLLETDRKITAKGLQRISSGLLPTGTLLLSSRAPVGYLAITEIPLAINQGYIAMLPGTLASSLYLLFWSQANMDRIKARAGGTTFAEISKRNFRPIPALLPPTAVLDRFEKIAKPLYRRIVNNEKEARLLSQLRDTLLPKLISGELRVPEAEEQVEAAL